jgi:hypothetical protein
MSALAVHPAFTIDQPRLETRAKIDAFEDALREQIGAGNVEQTIHDGESDEGSAQCTHHFADGVYARALWIPAGSAVVGKIHKQSRICIIAAGRCKFSDEYRSEEVAAPWIGEFSPNSKTAVIALEDTLWIAVLGTELRDPQEIVRTLTAPSWTAYAKQITEGVRQWHLPISAEA